VRKEKCLTNCAEEFDPPTRAPSWVTDLRTARAGERGGQGEAPRQVSEGTDYDAHDMEAEESLDLARIERSVQSNRQGGRIYLHLRGVSGRGIVQSEGEGELPNSWVSGRVQLDSVWERASPIDGQN
jgi:hypothetical protein